MGPRTSGPRKKLQAELLCGSEQRSNWYPFILDSDHVPAKARILGDYEKTKRNQNRMAGCACAGSLSARTSLPCGVEPLLRCAPRGLALRPQGVEVMWVPVPLWQQDRQQGCLRSSSPDPTCLLDAGTCRATRQRGPGATHRFVKSCLHPEHPCV